MAELESILAIVAPFLDTPIIYISRLFGGSKSHTEKCWLEYEALLNGIKPQTTRQNKLLLKLRGLYEAVYQAVSTSLNQAYKTIEEDFSR